MDRSLNWLIMSLNLFQDANLRREGRKLFTKIETGSEFLEKKKIG